MLTCSRPAPSERADIPAGFDGGEFIKTETCRSCGAQTKCYGLRRRYATLHGTQELRPLTIDAGQVSAPAA